MKLRLPFFLLPVFILWSACEPKPVTENAEDREHEIQARVAEKLADEHRTEQDRQLAAREQELAQREKDLKAHESERVRPRDADEQTPDTASVREQPAPVATRTATSSYDLFYRSLSDHGDWIELGDYGYVFHPTVAGGSNWRPYTNGYWAYSDYGWTWISNEPFGWATYHYGRWTRARGIGWVWVPGEEWAPAWVSWRSSDDYVGWAPLPPAAEYNDRVGISNWADSTYDIAPTQYNFVTVNNFSSQVIQQNIIAPQENVTIVNRTVNVTNIKTKNAFVVNEGPNVSVIRSRSSRPLQQFRIERNGEAHGGNAVVSGDSIQISAPVIRKASASAEPAHVKERVKNVTIETGWSGVGDAQTAQQIRGKLHEDAVAAPASPSPDSPAAIQQPPRKEDSARMPGRVVAPLPLPPTPIEGAPPLPTQTLPSQKPAHQQRPEQAVLPAPTVEETPSPAPVGMPLLPPQRRMQVPPAVLESASPTPTPVEAERPIQQPRREKIQGDAQRSQETEDSRKKQKKAAKQQAQEDPTR